VDALGRPLHIHLSAGNRNDLSEAGPLIARAQGRYFIADRGYDSDALLQAVASKGIKAVIPSTRNRRVPRPLNRQRYRLRHRVENFFCRIKRYRRVATRFEKLSTNYLGFVLFAAIRVWIA
jgi:putative transposase